MFFGIWLVVLGALGAASLIIAKKPEAKELIGKVQPYQGWIGVVSVLWGIWGIISILSALRWLGSITGLISFITLVVTVALLLGLGLLLGVNVIKQFVKDPNAQAKLDQTVAKIQPYQGNLGLLSIIVGIWMFVTSIIWTF